MYRVQGFKEWRRKMVIFDAEVHKPSSLPSFLADALWGN